MAKEENINSFNVTSTSYWVTFCSQTDQVNLNLPKFGPWALWYFTSVRLEENTIRTFFICLHKGFSE